MKRVFFVLTITCLLACNKSNDPNEKQDDTEDAAYFSGCISNLKSTKEEGYCLEIKSLKDKELLIVHKNAEFCCGSDSFDIDLNMSGDTILIHEIDKGPFSYCYCEHDLAYRIGPIEYGSYKIKIIESEHSDKRDTLFGEFQHTESTNFSTCK